jgi:hypothetical protein
VGEGRGGRSRGGEGDKAPAAEPARGAAGDSRRSGAHAALAARPAARRRRRRPRRRIVPARGGARRRAAARVGARRRAARDSTHAAALRRRGAARTACERAARARRRLRTCGGGGAGRGGAGRGGAGQGAGWARRRGRRTKCAERGAPTTKRKKKSRGDALGAARKDDFEAAAAVFDVKRYKAGRRAAEHGAVACAEGGGAGARSRVTAARQRERAGVARCSRVDVRRSRQAADITRCCTHPSCLAGTRPRTRAAKSGARLRLGRDGRANAGGEPGVCKASSGARASASARPAARAILTSGWRGGARGAAQREGVAEAAFRRREVEELAVMGKGAEVPHAAVAVGAAGGERQQRRQQQQRKAGGSHTAAGTRHLRRSQNWPVTASQQNAPASTGTHTHVVPLSHKQECVVSVAALRSSGGCGGGAGRSAWFSDDGQL